MESVSSADRQASSVDGEDTKAGEGFQSTAARLQPGWTLVSPHTNGRSRRLVRPPAGASQLLLRAILPDRAPRPREEVVHEAETDEREDRSEVPSNPGNRTRPRVPPAVEIRNLFRRRASESDNSLRGSLKDVSILEQVHPGSINRRTPRMGAWRFLLYVRCRRGHCNHAAAAHARRSSSLAHRSSHDPVWSLSNRCKGVKKSALLDDHGCADILRRFSAHR